MILKLSDLSSITKHGMAADLDGVLDWWNECLFIAVKQCPTHCDAHALTLFGKDYGAEFNAIIQLIQKQPMNVKSDISVAIGLKHDWCAWLNTTPMTLLDELLIATGKAKY